MYESLIIDVERWSGGQLKEIQGNYAMQNQQDRDIVSTLRAIFTMNTSCEWLSARVDK